MTAFHFFVIKNNNIFIVNFFLIDKGMLFSDRVLAQALLLHLCPSSFSALCIASKPFHSRMQSIGVTRGLVVHQKLFAALSNALGSVDAAAIILEACDQRHAYITGGFLLSVLNGEAIDRECDVDIMVQYLPEFEWFNGQIEVYPYPFMTLLNRIGVLDFIPNENRQHQVVNGDVTYCSSSALRSVIDFQVNGRKLQLLALTSLDFEEVEHHVGSFDFTFCRNWFGGGQVRVMNMISVVKKTCTIDLDSEYLIRRKISNTDHLHHTVMPKLYRRLSKYVFERGYHICMLPRQHETCKELVPFISDRDPFERFEAGEKSYIHRAAVAQMWISFWDERILNGKLLPGKEPAWK
jgi:hypothetical protein